MPRLERIFERYRKQASFLTVYIREAHPTDEWRMDENDSQNICYKQPRTEPERVAVAGDFVKRFQYRLPLAVDPIANPAEHLYAAWPERLYVIDERGVIVYKGGQGPFGYHPGEVEAWLARRFPRARAAR